MPPLDGILVLVTFSAMLQECHCVWCLSLCWHWLRCCPFWCFGCRFLCLVLWPQLRSLKEHGQLNGHVHWNEWMEIQTHCSAQKGWWALLTSPCLKGQAADCCSCFYKSGQSTKDPHVKLSSLWWQLLWGFLHDCSLSLCKMKSPGLVLCCILPRNIAENDIASQTQCCQEIPNSAKALRHYQMH